MEREQAVQLLDQYVQSDWLKKHSLATAAIMERLAGRLGGDADTWWIMGMLHDLDFDITQDPQEHGRKSEEILQEHGVSREIIRAILAHNADGLGLQRTDKLDYAITAAESITGLIVATALVMPDKKLASVKPESVVKRMKKKEFARKVSRESILLCEQAGIPLEEFAAIALGAMQSIAGELDL
ncbi:MAG: HD domain-containing protein [Spirochaetaceae bacterium]|nr:MAG: HD domain-containing protein [Spirochaetaceae bacterium]